MSERTGKVRKQYADCSLRKLKTYLIYVPGNSSDECKVLRDFSAKYAKVKRTKDCVNHCMPRFYFNSQQKNNGIVNNAVHEILLHETKKVSAAKEAPEFLESGYDENELYQVENMSLENTKE